MDGDISRRTFFALGGGTLLASTLPAYTVESDTPPRTAITEKLKRRPLTIHRHRVEVGRRSRSRRCTSPTRT